MATTGAASATIHAMPLDACLDYKWMCHFVAAAPPLFSDDEIVMRHLVTKRAHHQAEWME